MEKKFTKFELARMKRTAQNVDQFISKKNKLVAKITELQEQLNQVNRMIELTEAPTLEMTGGYGTEDIIEKVVIPTDKVDKNGNLIKETVYRFKYPDTIIPPVPSIPQEFDDSIPEGEKLTVNQEFADPDEEYRRMVNEEIEESNN